MKQIQAMLPMSERDIDRNQAIAIRLLLIRCLNVWGWGKASINNFSHTFDVINSRAYI